MYSLPAGSTITDGDTSSADDLNIPLADLEADANTARPIVAGGTGATSASGARTALGLAIGTDVQAFDPFLADIAALTDPGADRLLFWDDSAGDIVWLEAGSGLSISGTTITATGIGLTDGDKGDITVSSSGTVWSLDAGVVDTAELADDAVTLAKIADAVIVTEGEGIGSNDNDTTIPTSAAVKDYVDNNAGGSTLLATIPTTSGTSVSATSLTLTSYKFLKIVFDGVSFGTTTGSAITINSYAVSPTDGNNNYVYRGTMDIDLSDGVFSSVVAHLNGTTVADSGVFAGLSNITTASTTITFTRSGSGTFDAGEIRVYGVL